MSGSFITDVNFECEECEFEQKCPYQDAMFELDGIIDKQQRELKLPDVAKIRMKITCTKAKYRKEVTP